MRQGGRHPQRGIASPETHTGAAALPQIPGYHIVEELNHGGMGIVYKARHINLNRIVALKMILAGASAEPTSLARFRAEAKAVARLQHPHIAQVYEIGESDGLPYFSLEYVDGGTLAQRLTGTPEPPAQAAELMELVARAVHYAHERGILHRDLKPANILLTLAGAPKITDFGLAMRLVNAPASAVAAFPTGTGLVVGTPRYMAPEQAGPRAPGVIVGPPADIYSLGAILYELLVGRPLYQGDTPLDVLVRVLHEEPVPPRRIRPEVPRDLETICLKCLRKDPQQRYGSARGLADDLRRFLLGQPIAARPPSILYQLRKFARRHHAWVGGGAAIVLALTTGTVVSIIFATGEARQRQLADYNARRADTNALQAEAALQAALRDAYQTRLMAAVMAMGDHDVTEAAHQLDAAPAALRGWEWLHLWQRVQDETPIMVRAPQGNRIIPFPPGRGLVVVQGRKTYLRTLRSAAVLRELPDAAVLFLSATRPDPLLVLYLPGAPLCLVDEAGTVRRTESSFGPGLSRVAVSHDGLLLAACWDEGNPNARTVLMDLPSGKPRLRLQELGTAHSLAFSPDGTWLAAACPDHTIRLWQTATGKPDRILRGHTDRIRCLAFNPDGRTLLSAGDDETLRQWDTRTGQPLDVRRGLGGAVSVAVYSPDGHWIGSGSLDCTVRLWRVSGGEPVAILRGHTGAIAELSFSSDGIAIASADQVTARVWPMPAQADVRVLRGHTGSVYPVAYSPDGRFLASGGGDKVIRLWDAACGEQVAVLKGHTATVLALAFSPDGRSLVSRSDDGTLRVWDTDTGKTQAVLPCDQAFGRGNGNNVLITPDGKRVAAGAADEVRWWDLAGKPLSRLPMPVKGIRVLALRADGRLLAAAGADSTIAVVPLDSGQQPAVLIDGQGDIQTLAFSPDGRQLLSAGHDRVLRLWDVETGRLLKVLRGHTDEVLAAVFHPDGTRIASGGRDRSVRLWDTVSGAEVARLPGHANYVASLSFSPDGARLASGSGDYTVRLWETFPLEHRLEARRELQSLRLEAERLVERLWQQEPDASKVAERIRPDKTLSEPLHRAAWHAVLRRVATPAGAFEKPALPPGHRHW